MLQRSWKKYFFSGSTVPGKIYIIQGVPPIMRVKRWLKDHPWSLGEFVAFICQPSNRNIILELKQYSQYYY